MRKYHESADKSIFEYQVIRYFGYSCLRYKKPRICGVFRLYGKPLGNNLCLVVDFIIRKYKNIITRTLWKTPIQLILRCKWFFVRPQFAQNFQQVILIQFNETQIFIATEIIIDVSNQMDIQNVIRSLLVRVAMAVSTFPESSNRLSCEEVFWSQVTWHLKQ